MKKKIVLFLCVMGIMTVLTGCSSGSKEIYTPQNIQEKKAKKVSDKFVKKVQKEADCVNQYGKRQYGN